MKFTYVLIVATGLLIACTEQNKSPPKLRIALTSWPGAEFLYLADEMGFFDQLGLNVEIVQLAKFSDARLAFSSGKVDGISQSMFELIHSHQLESRAAQAVLLLDFSNGGDVLIADKTIKRIDDLKGKSIATDFSPISLFFIRQSLKTAGLELSDVQLQESDESEAIRQLNEGEVSASYSYPPYSNQILASGPFHSLLDSSQMPFTILDTLTLSESYLEVNPEVVIQLKTGWQMALDYAAQHPIQAYSLMAKREQLELEVFLESLKGIQVLSTYQQEELLNQNLSMQSLITDICEVLDILDNNSAPCPTAQQIFYLDGASRLQ